MEPVLDDANARNSDLVNNSFISSAAFSNALTNALAGQTMEVYDSFDRANFKTNVSSFFTSGSYTISKYCFKSYGKTSAKN